MDFARFRELRGWTLERAADEIKAGGDARFTGVNASLVAKHESGRHMPRPALMLRYKEITEGAVTYEDWLAAKERADRTAQSEAA